MKRCVRRRAAAWRLVCLLLAGILGPLPAVAASATGSMSSLERFIDGIMERSIVAGETVGATVAVVQNGRLVVARGYGLADVERGIPVEARVTAFRIGSISKVLVWMSVLQLVESGQLDLDTDVNTYLSDFKVSEDFTAPVTLRHLMTHTAGFEDSLVDLFVSGPRQVGTLATTLAAQMPERVRLPGTLAAYSNYGAALAGHVVAEVSGQSWDDYVDAHIFQPLNMAGATTRQPPPPEIESNRSKGYTRLDDDYAEQGFLYVPLAPAGAGTATALDMARLMVELLNPRGTSVLSAASKAQLLGGAYISNPLVNGMTLGMYEMSLGATRAVGHSGNTLLFNSQMILWPDEKMGVFVSTNTLGGEGVAPALVETVAARLGFANDTSELQEVRGGPGWAGRYIGARRNHSNYTKVMGLLDTVEVTHDRQAGVLWVTDNQGRKRYRQVADGVFQHTGGNERIVFQGADDDTQLYFSNRPMIGYTRADLMQTPVGNVLLIGVWFVLAAAVLLVWPVSSLTHRERSRARGQRVATVLSYLSVLVVLSFAVQLAGVGAGPYDLLVGGFAKLVPLLWYPVALAVLILLRLGYFFRVWIDGFWWPSRRLHFTLTLLAECALLGWFWYWNLLPEVLLGYVS